MEFSYRRALILFSLVGLTAGFAKDTNVLDQTPVWLDCPTNHSVEWFLQNARYSQDIFPNGTLLLKKVNMNHAGIWECRRKGERNALKAYFITVSAPARVTDMRISPGPEVMRGTLVDIACKGYGSLPFTWNWYQDGRALKFALRHNEKIEITGVTNAIELRVEYSTNITCAISNKHGKNRRSTRFVVHDGKRPTIPPPTTTTPVPSTTTKPKPVVKCLEYTGSFCKGLLPPGHRWVADSTAQLPMELLKREKLALRMQNATQKARLDATCARGLKALFCGRLYPACTRDRNAKLQAGQLCREHCTAVHSLFCPNKADRKSYDAIREKIRDVPKFLVPRLKAGDESCSGLPQASRLQAANTKTERPEASGPPCTEIVLERQMDPDPSSACYAGKGETYRGQASHFWASGQESEQPCAPWNSSKAATDLSANGYSLAAFPSLQSAGQTCRNPAGLSAWPFCVPANPTKTGLVRCAILSCTEYVIRNRPREPADISFLGLRVSVTEFSVMLSVILFVVGAFVIFTWYCCCCRQYVGSYKSRRLRLNAKKNGGLNAMPMMGTRSSVSVSIASEHDVSDAKSSLLTPNPDYHGKAVVEFINPKLQKLEYPREDIVDLKELGRGAFGEVSLVEARSRSTSDGEPAGSPIPMAMKVLKNDATQDTQLQFLREASLLADLKHDNIVRLLGISLIYKPFCMLMEYMCHGDLNSYLRRHDPNNTAMRVDIDQPAVALQSNGIAGGQRQVPSVSSQTSRDELSRLVLSKMAMEIAEGMIYLSLQNFVHRDLATRNCLLDINKTVKIADFGLCRHIKRGEDFIDDDNGAMPVRWMPLEAILERRFNLDTDVWSFGVLLWELFSYALQPYYGKTHEEVIEFLQKGSVLDKPPDAPDGVYVLMLRCWSRQRRDRPPFAFLKRQLAELNRRWTTVDVPNHVT